VQHDKLADDLPLDGSLIHNGGHAGLVLSSIYSASSRLKLGVLIFKEDFTRALRKPHAPELALQPSGKSSFAVDFLALAADFSFTAAVAKTSGKEGRNAGFRRT